MTFLLDAETLKSGLIIFRRSDVKHRNWYCRVKVPKADRYKVVSLKTADREVAREAAFDYDADVRFRLKHEVPVFNRPFSQIAEDFVKTQRERAETGGITKTRADNIESIVGMLNLCVGSKQIHVVGQADWNNYPVWRRRQKRRPKPEKPPEPGKKKLKLKLTPQGGDQAKKEDKDWRVSDWTIRAEMTVFRSIMVYAASRKFISESQIPKGKLHAADERREEFTREEYRALHTKGRPWRDGARTQASKWYREMVYNFVLVMCNTGMRPPEAKNLRWRDVAITTVKKDTRGRESIPESEARKAARGDEAKKAKPAKTRGDAVKGQDGEKAEEVRKIVVLNVRGKDKARRLVAPGNVTEYLERIRALAKATEPDDYVFTNYKGKPTGTLYASLVKKLLVDTKLLLGPAGSERSTYSFRHTYATLRLSEGVDVYLLAEQMGTSVQMIEKHYGHINPVKNADRILLGMHVWETPEAGEEHASESAAGETAGDDRVNAVEAETKPAKAGAANKARMNKGAAPAQAARPGAAGHGRVNKAKAAKGPHGRRNPLH